MKYFSTETKKIQDSIEELEVAEAEANKVKDARKAEAENVEKAFAQMKEAKKAYEVAAQEYQKSLTSFCEKYGSYKTTIKNGDMFNLDPFWKFFMF